MNDKLNQAFEEWWESYKINHPAEEIDREPAEYAWEAACAYLWCEIARPMCQAYLELNTIRARDGVPYTHYGRSDVCEEYFSEVVDKLDAAVRLLTGQAAHCHPSLYKTKG
jgi:hypothetical protein